MSVIYVGQSVSAQGTATGISVLFSAPLARDQDWQRLIKVRDSHGQSIQLPWRYSSNPRAIFMTGLIAGTYTLTIEPLVQAADGQMLNTAVQGPITLR